MSKLSDRIAREHAEVGLLGRECVCGWTGAGNRLSRHVAEVTEAAVREQVAREIAEEGRRREKAFLEANAGHPSNTATLISECFARAARIARNT